MTIEEKRLFQLEVKRKWDAYFKVTVTTVAHIIINPVPKIKPCGEDDDVDDDSDNPPKPKPPVKDCLMSSTEGARRRRRRRF